MKPGISVTALNSAPNSSSQMIGCTSAMNRNAGWRRDHAQVAEGDLPGLAQRGHAASSQVRPA